MIRRQFEHYVPLPVELELRRPATDVPVQMAQFQGAWAGTWEDDWRHILVVESIDANGRAQVIYATGEFAPSYAPGSWKRSIAKIEGTGLSIQWPTATAQYTADGPDRLVATYVTPDGNTTLGLLSRFDTKKLGSPQLLEHPIVPGERVFLPHKTLRRTDGSPVQLEARLYRPKGSASSPVAIVNHGSAIGRDVHASRSGFADAQWLMDQGYAVVVPMRRGRGQSEGDYGEDNYGRSRTGEIVDVSVGIDEAVEDLTSVIAFGRSLPFVQAGPVLLVGQSRGGFLSVVYAGRYPSDVHSVINFVGGWLGGAATEHLNTPFFAAAGRGSGQGVSQLWLYGDGDSHYGETHIRANVTAFTEGGGACQFHFFTHPKGIGHNVCYYPDVWQPIAKRFLGTLKG